MKKPKTLQQAIVYFSNPDNCLNWVAKLRWPDGVECPTCGRKDARFLENQRKWQCKSVHPKRQFSVKVGTIFEDSPLPLDKWLVAVWMVTNCKNGVSSYEVGRALGVTQKSAWFMLHRIRLAMQKRSLSKVGGRGKEGRSGRDFHWRRGPIHAPRQAPPPDYRNRNQRQDSGHGDSGAGRRSPRYPRFPLAGKMHCTRKSSTMSSTAVRSTPTRFSPIKG